MTLDLKMYIIRTIDLHNLALKVGDAVLPNKQEDADFLSARLGMPISIDQVMIVDQIPGTGYSVVVRLDDKKAFCSSNTFRVVPGNHKARVLDELRNTALELLNKIKEAEEQPEEFFGDIHL